MKKAYPYSFNELAKAAHAHYAGLGRCHLLVERDHCIVPSCKVLHSGLHDRLTHCVLCTQRRAVVSRFGEVQGLQLIEGEAATEPRQTTSVVSQEGGWLADGRSE